MGHDANRRASLDAAAMRDALARFRDGAPSGHGRGSSRSTPAATTRSVAAVRPGWRRSWIEPRTMMGLRHVVRFTTARDGEPVEHVTDPMVQMRLVPR